MSKIKRLALICFFAASVTIATHAQGRNSIEGRVVAVNGSGVEDARVILKNQNYADVGQDITDAMGNYRFTSVAEGVYYIEVLPLGTGYEGATRRVEVAGLSRRPGG